MGRVLPSHHTCAVQTREAMDRVTAELCQKQIQHCHAWIERFMKSDEGGSLTQFATLQVLKPFASTMLQVDPTPPAAVQTAEDSDDDQEGADEAQ